MFRDRAPTVQAPASTPTTTTEPALFVGRDAELRAIVEADPTGGVVIVTGEAGAGKSRLLARAREQLTAAGRTVIVGRCPEFAGAPAAWAWVEALRELALRAPPDDPVALSPILDEPAEGNTTAVTAAAGRFRLHRAVVAWLRAAAAGAPLAILLDDLHRADGETLALLEAVTGPGGAPILVVTGHRPTEVGERLAETLAALARRSPRRVPLTGLPPSDVETLVAAVCGRPVDAATVDALAERTGGNPFYVWESARLLASEGALVATSDVPQGVRDVLRRRMARLPQPVVSVLRLAAVVGREADVEVLIDAADIDEDGVLDALEAGLMAGLLTEPAPGRVRFEHALVRDTLYTDLAQLRRSRMHARLAEAIRRTRPDDLSGLAYHYAQAATVATASQAVEYGLRAAEQAEARYAHDAAVELLQQAVEAFDRLPADGTDRDARLVDLLRRLLQAQVRAGAVLAARETRQQAVAVAQRASRDDLLVAAFAAWTEPAPWQTRPYGTVDYAVVAQLERLIARDDLDRVTRGRLLHAFVAELNREDDPRVQPAAARELAIAREVGDPALVAAALTSIAQSQRYDQDAEVRPPIATELRELGRAYQMPAYVWLGEHIDGTVAAARNDPDGVRRHALTGLELARQYRMGEAEAVNLSTLAMLDHVQGRFDEAERGYAQLGEQMMRLGAINAAGFHALARITVCLSRQRCEDLDAALQDVHAQVGSPADDVYAYALTLLGRHDEARAVDRSKPVRPDYFHGFFLTVRVEAALALGELDRAAALAPHLVPVQDQLAGAATTSLAVWPVALTLGRLHRALGDETAAQEQFARAGQVARAWRSAHWAAEADRLAGREVRSK